MASVLALMHTIAGVFIKIATAAIMVVLVPHSTVTLPKVTTIPPWELPGHAQVASTTLPKPAPSIISTTASSTSGTKITSTTPPSETKPKPTTQPTPTPAPTTSTTSSPPNVSTITNSDLNTKARNALVNVLCVTGSGGYLKPISGSGILIDPRGVVLTNAHIGQFFLLRDYPYEDNVQCVLRTGSPAVSTYTAALLYFPKQWLNTNAAKIVQESPTGTGENDFALLLITGRTNPNASLPASFPYLEPDTGAEVKVGDEILLAGYPAGFLEGASITTNLYIASAVGAIGQIFTFKEGGGDDLISIPGTILSQKGSSGGAAVRADNGKLTGLIVTATLADSTAQRDLRAITLRHINLAMIAGLNQSLSAYLTGNLLEKAYDFNLNVVPLLSKMLTDVLDK